MGHSAAVGAAGGEGEAQPGCSGTQDGDEVWQAGAHEYQSWMNHPEWEP